MSIGLADQKLGYGAHFLLSMTAPAVWSIIALAGGFGRNSEADDARIGAIPVRANQGFALACGCGARIGFFSTWPFLWRFGPRLIARPITRLRPAICTRFT
jgi:hypothetical protein